MSYIKYFCKETGVVVVFYNAMCMYLPQSIQVVGADVVQTPYARQVRTFWPTSLYPVSHVYTAWSSNPCPNDVSTLPLSGADNSPQSKVETSDWTVISSIHQTQGRDMWTWKGSKCYWIRKHIEPFCIHPANSTLQFELIYRFIYLSLINKLSYI